MNKNNNKQQVSNKKNIQQPKTTATTTKNNKNNKNDIEKKKEKNVGIKVPAEKKESLMETLERVITELNSHPEAFIDQPKDIAKSMTDYLVRLYDTVKKNEPIPTDSLEHILLDGFDYEQIWSQIDLFNNPIISHLDSNIKSLLANIKDVNLIDDQDDDDEDDLELGDDDYDEDDLELGEDDDYLEDDEEEEEDPISGSLGEDDDDYEDDDGVEDEEDEDELDDGEGFDLGMDDEDEDEEGEDEEEDEDKPLTKTKKSNMKFFDQKEMEQFLDDADDNEDEDDEEKDFELGDEDDDEDDGMVFPEGEMDETERHLDKLLDKYMNEDSSTKAKKKQVKAEDMKFDDFFKGEGEEDEDDEEFPLNGRDDYEEDEDEDGLDDEDEEDGAGLGLEDDDVALQEDNEPTLPPQELSEFEKKAQRVQDKIKELEKQNLKKKNWTVIGEAAAKDRPVNSLLSENLDFEHTQRLAPVITQESNQTIEDIIKKRVLERNFDDVIRKTEKEFQEKYKAKLELNDQKNTEGLGSVYEKEYLTKTMGVELTDELKEKHNTINKLMEALMYKLNSLSNFNFTPNRIKQQELVVNKASSITMEEKLPTATSTAELVAPKDIYFKEIADEAGYSELSQQEKKQLRSKLTDSWSKEKKKTEAQQRIDEKLNPQLAKKHETKRAVDHLKTARNTTIVDTSDQRKTTSYAKSGTVFAKLQTEQDNKRKGVQTEQQPSNYKKQKNSNNNNGNNKGSSSNYKL
ncbi:U3 snoRNP protein [Heterostelium album PN500]|uniref:U3 small nucleolar ribonucleoprotein protein MPP10 n=1 Tax=Heterostelium pallidum (strain ATCC 26659 / Pp 5 / PN500) TaxID=670386 RepID=D3BC65_HETP5|nr:U3 snoRNP protein [Heterostelium album PN500]EFA81248.1 U3 snoRNP protein [Heterostelium album PN500]|eukprot:XP_020433366.1 U3 snoRNP protein [Heterostelium album PN500]